MPVPNEPIRQIALEIYGGCNYKCPMCPQAEGREADFLKRMPFEVFKKVVDEGKSMGVEVISLQGSGEPTMHPEMPRFAAYVKSRGIQCISLTNGFMLTPKLSRELIESGLDILRVSAIGHDRPSYQKWMSKDAFELVRKQVKEFLRLNRELGGKTELTLYHLILDDKQKDFEIQQYRRNWIDECGAPGEIWMMHNWGGQYEGPYHRQGLKKRSCGRPASPYLTVRAGGPDGHAASVVPCCFVLGQDSKAVLGNLDAQTISEVVAGAPYQDLRDKHAKGDFDSIDYCKNCDQLYDAPESLVWTNIPGKEYGQSKVLQDLDYRKWTV